MAMCRVVQKTYINDTCQEEPGGITDCIQHDGGRSIVKRREVDDPKSLDARSLGMDNDRYPTQDYEGDAAYVGSAEFSYVLEVQQPDGSWKFVKMINPYPIEEDYCDQDYDWDVADVYD